MTNLIENINKIKSVMAVLDEQFFPIKNEYDELLKQAKEAGWPMVYTLEGLKQLPKNQFGKIINYKLDGINQTLIMIFYDVEKKFGEKLPIEFGRRDIKTNQSVGGAKDSAHLQGYAIDIKFPTIRRDAIVKLINLFSQYPEIMGLGIYKDGDVLHVDNSPKRVKRQTWSTGNLPTPEWAKDAVNKFLKK